MSNHGAPQIERQCDVLVVGGSAAGSAAALQLVRQRRSVIVVDGGTPRNAPAAHMHGFLGRDGSPPSELLATAREEIRRYGGEMLDGRVVGVEPGGEADFRAELTGGHAVVARRLAIATGITDVLPDIPGVAEQWGRGVIHCPFCHGYEVRDQRVVQIVTHPMGLHPAGLFRHLTAELTLVVHGDVELDAAQVDALEAAGVLVVHDQVDRVVSTPDGMISSVELRDGTSIASDAVVVGPQFRPNVAPFDELGVRLAPHASGLGDVIDTDATGATSAPGVWAAGNVTDPSLQVLPAAAHGAQVGAMIAFDLARDDLVGARGSSCEAEWDRRYGGEQIWSGSPNGALVAELSGVRPSTALDVGAGEGGDAIWLAEQGWTVAAADISAVALTRVRAEAARRDLEVDCMRCDANALDPFDGRRFDLVTAFYASIPRTPDARAVRGLADAVAPGGTLLVVGHDPEPMRRPLDPSVASRAFDPDAYVGVEDIAAWIRDDPAWTIEVDEKRQRPPGAASASHHADDLVLRARRDRGSPLEW